MSSNFQDNTRTKSASSYYNFKDSNTTNNNYTTSFTTRPDYSYQLEENYNIIQIAKHSSVAGIIARHSNVPEFTSVNTNNPATLSQDISNLSNRLELITTVHLSTYIPPFRLLDIFRGIDKIIAQYLEDHQTPRISAIYKPTQNLTFKLLLGTGFREPSAFEF